jgi:hypothetical protein
MRWGTAIIAVFDFVVGTSAAGNLTLRHTNANKSHRGVNRIKGICQSFYTETSPSCHHEPVAQKTSGPD